MNEENKPLIIIGIVTILIIVGGIFLTSRQSSSPKSTPAPVSQEILVPEGSIKESTPSAQVTLVEFADFQCPTCKTVEPFIKQIRKDFAGQLTYVYRYFPLDSHKNAVPSALAAEAANQQGKFWQMHDMLYEKQDDWADSNTPKDIFIEYAKTLKLDIEKFKKDFDDPKTKEKVEKDKVDGYAAGVGGTPTFYINGTKIPAVPTYETLKSLIEQELPIASSSAVPQATASATQK